MSFLAVGSLVVGAAGVAVSYSSAKAAEESAEAQADFELASTEKRIKEEQDRASQNVLRAQEEKRKELSRQRAAFIKAGVLPSSPSADFVIGALGENLQTRIHDVFTGASDRIQSISSQGNARHFDALQNAKASSRQATGALIAGASNLGTSAYKLNRQGAFGGGSSPST